jgi:4-amino-4-deoxy-L-arabinose transferase-like glycosyltransferase
LKRSKKESSSSARFFTPPPKWVRVTGSVGPGARTWRDIGFPRWSGLHSYAFLALATVLCFVPFSGRAFHVDDTLFVRAGQQIAQHPFNPYGFEINWDAAQIPMSQITQNPPLDSYYIALVGRCLGWSERALHLGFILVAIALVLGTYCLANKFTRSPLLAALCTLLTPGILVSASSVMCDTMMLALWIWAAYFWIEGLEPRRNWFLFVSAVLMAASALTKYFGASLILLLLVYSIVRLKRVGFYLLYLLIPIAALVAYEFWTASLYGHGLLSGAAEFAQSERVFRQSSYVGTVVVALSFAGGCSLVGLSFAGLLWSRKHIVAALALGGIGGLTFAKGWFDTGWASKVNEFPTEPSHSLPWFICCELALCIAAGLFVLGLAINDFWETRSSESLFLGLWVFGTFFFTAFVNWTINARSVLPLIPAAAILLARRFDHLPSIPTKKLAIQVGVVLLASALFSVWITAADTALANSERNAATLVYNKTYDKGRTVWFVGHWGFQYYLESLGVAPLDLTAPQAHSGDFVVIAQNNSHFAAVLPSFIASKEDVELPLKSWATTISFDLGAGFYASSWGPIPYAIGPVPSERYSIIRLGTLPGQSPSQ